MRYVAMFKTRPTQQPFAWAFPGLRCWWWALFFFPLSIFGQTQISGEVIDEEGAAVFAANVYWKSNPQSGTTSDLDGSFLLVVPDVATPDTLIVSFIGFREWATPSSEISKTEPVTIQLETEASALQTVYVEASKSISEEFAVAQLKKLDIYLNPVSAADPLKAITLLASSTNTDESANPSLRGSSFARSRVVLNGVPVINPVRNSQINGLGNFSLFNTELIAFQNVYPGNPPIIYGNASAGLVEIETREDLQKNKYQATVSLANLGVFASQKLGKKTFVQAYGNYQFPDAFLQLNGKSFGGLKDFGAKDYGINFHSQLGEQWSVNIFNYGIDEAYRITQNLFNYEGEALSGRWRNFTVANLRFQAETYWLSFNQGVDWSESDYSFGNLTSDKSEAQYYSSVNYKQFLTPELSIQSGAAYESGKTDFFNRSPVYYFALSPEAPSAEQTVNLRNEILEGYLYLKWEISKLLTWSGGTRKNWPLKGQVHYWSGQSSARLNLSDAHSFILGGGYYHNFSVPSFYDVNYQLLSSSQLALEYFFKKGNWDIQVAGFYKKEKGDVRLLPGEPLSTRREIIGAEIRADWVWKERFKLTLANTFLHAQITNGQQSFRAQNDFDYFFKAVASYTHPKLGALAISCVQRPGLFYTPVIGGQFVEAADTYEPIYSTQTNSAQLDFYSTLDLNYSKMIQLRGTSNMIVYATLSNILDRTNQRNPLYNNNYETIVAYDRYQRRSFYIGMLFSLYK